MSPADAVIGFRNWESRKINNAECDVLKPRELLLHVLKYKKTPIEWDLKVILLVGGQGSGKTVLIRYLIYLIRNIPDYTLNDGLSVIRTNDSRILGDHRYSKIFDKKRVIVLVVDDVIKEGFDSRRAMSGANVQITREFCTVRHTLEENYEQSGIIFMVFATQILTRIDPTIRDTAQLTIFTDYYDENWFHGIFSPKQIAFMREACHEGMVGSNFDARRFAACKTKSGYTAIIEVPFSTKEQVPYKYIDRSIDRKVVVDRLIQEILTEIPRIGDYTNGEIYGFLDEKKEEIENDFKIVLKKADFLRAVNRARWLQKREGFGEDGINTGASQSFLDRIIQCVKARKIASSDEISEFTGIPKNKVGRYLINNDETFERVSRGYYCIKGCEYSLDDVFKLTGKQPESLKKKLVMPD